MKDSKTFINDFMNNLEDGKFEDRGMFDPALDGEELTEEIVKKHVDEYNYLLNSEIYDYLVDMEKNKVRNKKKYSKK